MGLLQTFVVQLKRNVFYSFEKQILLNIQMSLHSSTFKWKIFKKNVLFSGSRIRKRRSTLILSEKVWAHSFPHSPHPKSYEFICRASFVWVFAREEAEGGREWLSCHVHLNIRTFCSKGKVEKKLVRVGTLVFTSDCILFISDCGKFPKTTEKLK